MISWMVLKGFKLEKVASPRVRELRLTNPQILVPKSEGIKVVSVMARATLLVGLASMGPAVSIGTHIKEGAQEKKRAFFKKILSFRGLKKMIRHS
jgi:ribonuclease HIII